MVEVNFNRHDVHDVVALRRVTELQQWQHDETSNTVTIGAGVPYAEMENGELARLFPALAEAARTVGSPQIRAAGTLGAIWALARQRATGYRCCLHSTPSLISLHIVARDRYL